jgi:hypothetical protein
MNDNETALNKNISKAYGFEAGKSILQAEHTKHRKTIAVSGSLNEENRVKPEGFGVNQIIAKPFRN